jgi:hypothetical protein
MKRLPDQNNDADVEAWTNEKLDVLEAWDERFVRRHEDEIADHLVDGWREIDIARGAPRGIPPEDFARAWNDPSYVPPKPGPDIEPLRKRFPQLKEFLHLPKMKRGQHRPTFRASDPVEFAVEDVRRIRRIWKARKFKRVQRGRITPEEIAAKRNRVSLKTLQSRLHPGGSKPIGSRRKSAPHSR